MNLTHSCKITDIELTDVFNSQPYATDDQVIFTILKAKGAPIAGYLSLRAKEGYDWKMTEDLMSGDVLCEWGIKEMAAK